MKKNNYGAFFEKLTKKKINKYATTTSIDAEVERCLRKKLQSRFFNSKLVPRRGSVFALISNETSKDIDDIIDAFINH